MKYVFSFICELIFRPSGTYFTVIKVPEGRNIGRKIIKPTPQSPRGTEYEFQFETSIRDFYSVGNR